MQWASASAVKAISGQDLVKIPLVILQIKMIFGNITSLLIIGHAKQISVALEDQKQQVLALDVTVISGLVPTSLSIIMTGGNTHHQVFLLYSLLPLMLPCKKQMHCLAGKLPMMSTLLISIFS